MEHLPERVAAFDSLTFRYMSMHPYGARGTLRRKREFTPDEKKDTVYWEKRRKNNEAARRSREKRRFNDFAIENQVAALQEENLHLRLELLHLKARFGLLNRTPEMPSTQVHSLLRMEDACWFSAPKAAEDPMECMALNPTNFMYLSREFFASDIPLLYNMSSPPAKSFKECSFFHPALSPTFFNYCLFRNCSSPFPTFQDSFLPTMLPNTAETGKQSPGITSSIGEGPEVSKFPSHELLQTSETFPSILSHSALPHKLRIKTKYFPFWNNGNIDGHHKGE
ncbi:NFIL3 like protein-like [Varanus komodoensis]|uniref:NFIL3 like protein-like n=1 Tax=Varanus komodoensis TaxID=61221 RepID=UPI001CF7A05E|nr:NFIL3 like protein-like [Varanus komodoensis]